MSLIFDSSTDSPMGDPGFQMVDSGPSQPKSKDLPRDSSARDTSRDTFGQLRPIFGSGEWDAKELRALDRRQNSIVAKILRFFYC